MITLEQVINNFQKRKEMSEACMRKYLEEDQKTIRESNDPVERDKAMHGIMSYCYSYEHYNQQVEVDKAVLETRYQEMKNMTSALSKAFDCEWIDDISFAVTTKHERLSDFAYMLANWFNIKSTSGFTFGSSFTTHNGKTEHDLYLDITCTDDGRGLIVFKGLQPGLPYWVPRSFAEEYEKNTK